MLHPSNRQQAAYQALLPYTDDLKLKSLTYTRTQQPLNSLSESAQRLHNVSKDDCILLPPALPLSAAKYPKLALGTITARFSVAILLLQLSVSYMHLATYHPVGHTPGPAGTRGAVRNLT